MGGLASALLPAVRKSGVVWFGSSGKTRRTVPGATPFVQVESYGRGTIATVDLPDEDSPTSTWIAAGSSATSRAPR